MPSRSVHADYACGWRDNWAMLISQSQVRHLTTARTDVKADGFYRFKIGPIFGRPGRERVELFALGAAGSGHLRMRTV
jgi:hypothetical protein